MRIIPCASGTCLRPATTEGYNRGLSTVQHGKSQSLATAAKQLVHAGRRFDQRGWVMGTSGNFSVVIDRDPVRLAITSSGTFKGELGTDQILEMDERGAPDPSRGRARVGRGPPARRDRSRARRRRGAAHAFHLEHAAVRAVSGRAAVSIEGYEMLKGLEGVRTHEHREWLPIVDNDQDMARLSGVVRGVLDAASRRARLPAARPRALHLGRRSSAGSAARRDSGVLAGSRWGEADSALALEELHGPHGHREDSL